MLLAFVIIVKHDNVREGFFAGILSRHSEGFCFDSSYESVK